MASWNCTVCSYVHESDESPEICPVCGASREKFVEEGGFEGVMEEEPIEEKWIEEEEEDVLAQVEPQEAKYEHRTVSKEEEYHNESFVKKILYSGLHETALYCFKPGQKQNVHSHPTGDQTIYVIKGKGELNVGGETKKINEGELIILPKGAKHSIKNSGEVNLVLLQVTNPVPYESKSV